RFTGAAAARRRRHCLQHLRGTAVVLLGLEPPGSHRACERFLAELAVVSGHWRIQRHGAAERATGLARICGPGARIGRAGRRPVWRRAAPSQMILFSLAREAGLGWAIASRFPVVTLHSS